MRCSRRGERCVEPDVPVRILAGGVRQNGRISIQGKASHQHRHRTGGPVRAPPGDVGGKSDASNLGRGKPAVKSIENLVYFIIMAERPAITPFRVMSRASSLVTVPCFALEWDIFFDSHCTVDSPKSEHNLHPTFVHYMEGGIHDFFCFHKNFGSKPNVLDIEILFSV